MVHPMPRLPLTHCTQTSMVHPMPRLPLTHCMQEPDSPYTCNGDPIGSCRTIDSVVETLRELGKCVVQVSCRCSAGVCCVAVRVCV